MKSYYNYESDANFLLSVVKLKGDDKFGTIVDFSNSHGLMFGVIFPNVHGSRGRTDTMTVEWHEPDELVFTT